MRFHNSQAQPQGCDWDNFIGIAVQGTAGLLSVTDFTAKRKLLPRGAYLVRETPLRYADLIDSSTTAFPGCPQNARCIPTLPCGLAQSRHATFTGLRVRIQLPEHRWRAIAVRTGDGDTARPVPA